MPTDPTVGITGLEDTLSVPGDARLELESEAERRVGPYRLLQLIGEGGMGEVWLAEQVEPRRRVALKVIKAGMDTKEVVARFESERQALALMDHPAIAKVFDGGSTPEGRPYFAMEYVAGVPITAHCDTHQLSTASRFELFIEVCEGIQHAHQKAIIHRDLKPSNILVSLVNGKAQPKVIDFGIAKATGQRLTDKTLFTEVGTVIGTPEYMSPEQADLTGQDVDTRTDVYSLGVVLYELLTGRLPFGSAELRSSSLDEMRRKLREVDPPRPSTKLTTLGEDASETARRRNTDPRSLRRQLEGDIDAITMKALEKERSRRYGTPSELAADLRAYLQHRPIVARPASARYRLAKYAQRHRVAVAVGGGLALLLIGFSITEAIQVRLITRERDRANRVADFMTNVFKVSDPSEARGNTITARELLDKASRDISTGLSKDPELQAQMMDLMGRVYQRLGLLSTAEGLLSKAVDIRREVLGREHPDTLLSMNRLGNSLSDQGKLTEGDVYYRQVLESSRRTLGPGHRTTLAAMNNLALNLLHEGQIVEAEEMQREVVEVLRRTVGADHPDTLTATSNIALSLRRQGRFADAEKTNRQVLERRRQTLGPDHPDTLRSAANLVLDLEDQRGRSAEAEQLLRTTLEAQKRILGPTHPDTFESTRMLATLLGQEGKRGEQEALLKDLVETERRSLGPEHPKTLDSISNFGEALKEQGKFREAEEKFRSVLEIQRRLRGPEAYDTLVAQTSLAGVLEDEKRYVESERTGREALDIERRKLGESSPVTLEQMSSLARVLERLGRDAEAEKLLREASDGQARVLGPDHEQTALSIYTLGVWAARRGETQRAFELLRQAVTHGLDTKTKLGLETERDLESLHADPRFAGLVAAAHGSASHE